MLIFLALALAANRPPDAIERNLADRCGLEVPRSAFMTYQGKFWWVLYDEQISPDKIRCIEEWAKAWPKPGGILAYPQNSFVPRSFDDYPRHHHVDGRPVGGGPSSRPLARDDRRSPYADGSHGSAYYGPDYGAPYFGGGYYDRGVYYRERRD